MLSVSLKRKKEEEESGGGGRGGVGGKKKRKKKTVSSVRILCLEEERSISVKGERCLLLSMEINLPVVQFNVLEKNILFS